MSTISNRFFVEAIDDGSTLHGSLLSTKPLTQAWTSGGAAVPNWEQAANQPVVYVDLLNGTDRVVPDAGGVWSYNGTPIDFNTDDRFVVVNDHQPTGYTSPVPAIRIVKNLASSQNVNTDSISYDGNYTLAEAQIGFNVTTFVRITTVSAAGAFGLIYFVGTNVVTRDGDKVYMYGKMYDADGALMDAGAYSTQWYLNEVAIGTGSDIIVDGVTYHHGMIISEDDSLGSAKEITDNAIVACTFTKLSDQNIQFTARESVDDQTDPEQMYIQYSGGDGSEAQLRKGKSITYSIWIGKMDDATPDDSWTTFEAKLLGSNGEEVTKTLPGIADRDASTGWRPLIVSGGVAAITLTYDVVKTEFKKYLTGIVKASK